MNELPLEPALDFMQHLWHLNHALERTSLQMERTLGVTSQQRLIIRCIGKYPGMTASQLSNVLHLDPGTVSVSLTRLVKKGLVTKRRDPKDSRRSSLGLSALGRTFNQPSPESVEFAVERLISKVGKSELELVKRVLRQLAEELT